MTRIGSRYRYRVVMGLLIVSVPVTIALAALLTQKASTSLTASPAPRSRPTAAIALHLEDFVAERQANLMTAPAGIGQPLEPYCLDPRRPHRQVFG